MWLLVIIARLEGAPSIGPLWLRIGLVLGPAVFLVVGLAGLVLANGFLAYPPDYAKPLIVAIEFALTISIAAVLAMLAAGPPKQVQQQ
jgi:hypothetical protein